MATMQSKTERHGIPALDGETRPVRIRQEALHSSVPDEISRMPGSTPRASAEGGYYGLPVLKTPPWTWEIPV